MEVPRCQSWIIRYYRHVQCVHPLDHEGDHEGEVMGHEFTWENEDERSTESS